MMLTIDRERSALLVIDFQQRLMPAIEDGAAAVGQCRRLLQAAEMLDVPILFTEHNAGGLGPTVAELADSAEGRLAHKMTFDACRMARFLDRLGDRRDIVVAGCETHVCVMQTALGLLDAGRRVYLVRDAVGSRRCGKQGDRDRAPGAARRRDRHHRNGRVRMARLGRASPLPRCHRPNKIGGASRGRPGVSESGEDLVSSVSPASSSGTQSDGTAERRSAAAASS